MKSAINSPTDMCIIVTYRCPMQCQMCNIWQNPTDKNKEITPAEIEKLPKVKFIILQEENLLSGRIWKKL